MSGDGSAYEVIAGIVADDPDAMLCLSALRALDLPDAWAAAGFVRNRVWDHLAGRVTSAATDDVDVVYFDPADPEGKREPEHEARLARALPTMRWQVRNQARMHVRNHDAPYRDTADAVAHWLETATAIGIRLRADDAFEILAPHGVGELMAFVCRPTRAGLDKLDQYRARIAEKGWRERWPELAVIDPV